MISSRQRWKGWCLSGDAERQSGRRLLIDARAPTLGLRRFGKPGMKAELRLSRAVSLMWNSLDAHPTNHGERVGSRSA